MTRNLLAEVTVIDQTGQRIKVSEAWYQKRLPEGDGVPSLEDGAQVWGSVQQQRGVASGQSLASAQPQAFLLIFACGDTACLPLICDNPSLWS